MGEVDFKSDELDALLAKLKVINTKEARKIILEASVIFNTRLEANTPVSTGISAEKHKRRMITKVNFPDKLKNSVTKSKVSGIKDSEPTIDLGYSSYIAHFVNGGANSMDHKKPSHRRNQSAQDFYEKTRNETYDEIIELYEDYVRRLLS